MNPKNLQIKKPAAQKNTGISRNPYGQNVIINKEEHYGSKTNSEARRVPSEPASDQHSRHNQKITNPSMAREFQNNGISKSQGRNMEVNGDKAPQTAPNRMNNRLGNLRNQQSPDQALRSQINSSKGQKLPVNGNKSDYRSPQKDEPADFDTLPDLKYLRAQKEKNSPSKLNKKDASSWPEEEQISSTPSRNQNTESENEDQNEIINITPSQKTDSDIKMELGSSLRNSSHFERPNENYSKEQQEGLGSTSTAPFAMTGGLAISQKSAVRGSFMNEHIPQSELQKREEQKRLMKEALEMQMNEKKRKKEEEKQQEKELQKKEEERIRKENEEIKRELELEKEAKLKKMQAHLNQTAQIQKPVDTVENKRHRARIQREEQELQQKSENHSIATDSKNQESKFQSPNIKSSHSNPEPQNNLKNETDLVTGKLTKLEEDNIKLKEENSKQGEVIDLLLNAFKNRKGDSQPTTKLLEELSELRVKQVQSVTPGIIKTNQMHTAENEAEDNQPYSASYINDKKRPKASSLQYNSSQQFLHNYAPNPIEEFEQAPRSIENLSSYRTQLKQQHHQGYGMSNDIIHNSAYSRNNFTNQNDQESHVPRRYYDQSSQYSSHMNGFNMSRPQQQNADFNQVPMFSPSNFGNFKQGISHNPMYSAGDVDIVHQKERLLLSRYPYSDFSTNDKIVKSAPYHQQQNPWSHEMTEMASRGLNNVQLRQSYSEFQPTLDHGQRHFSHQQPRAQPTNYNDVMSRTIVNKTSYKPNNFAGPNNDFSNNVAIERLRQRQNQEAQMGTNTVSIVDEMISNNNKPGALRTTFVKSSINPRETAPRFAHLMGDGIHFRENPENMQIDSNLGFRSNIEDPKFPKNIFNTGTKKNYIA